MGYELDLKFFLGREIANPDCRSRLPIPAYVDRSPPADIIQMLDAAESLVSVMSSQLLGGILSCHPPMCTLVMVGPMCVRAKNSLFITAYTSQ